MWGSETSTTLAPARSSSATPARTASSASASAALLRAASSASKSDPRPAAAEEIVRGEEGWTLESLAAVGPAELDQLATAAGMTKTPIKGTESRFATNP